MATIHQFRHHAMATFFDLRISNEDAMYAAQVAQAAFDRVDDLESRLSRFRPQSEIQCIARLLPGQSLRLSEDTFDCLTLARKMEQATRQAFSPTPAALQSQATLPGWSLSPADLSIRCEHGLVNFDLGAIGKGFALDRLAALLRQWECPSFLLIAGGSSIIAGDTPDGFDGWSCGLGDEGAPHRLLLNNASLSGSGVAVKGNHILNPRTGGSAHRQSRAWALCDVAAESDALSTAAMVLPEPELTDVLASEPTWLVLVEDDSQIRTIGKHPVTL